MSLYYSINLFMLLGTKQKSLNPTHDTGNIYFKESRIYIHTKPLKARFTTNKIDIHEGKLSKSDT